MTRRTATFFCTIAALGAAPAAAEAAEILSFPAVADTYVDSSHPKTSYGTATALWVDGSPAKQMLMRFDVSGIGARTVTNAWISVYSKDASALGGRIRRVSSTSWSESINWNTRPALDGATVGSFGAVASRRWYDAEVTQAITGDGPVTLGLDSTSGDGARWQSRESTTPPRLYVAVEEASTIVDGLSTVAGALVGSSDPTYYAMQHRLAKTAGGRLLAVHGVHASGVRVAWRDPSSGWSNATRGVNTGGDLLSGTGTGDWPASIAVGRDSSGAEHAWVVFAGPYVNSNPRALKLARLSDLDSPDGPVVGPTINLDGTDAAYKVDVAVETAPGGGHRVAVGWGRPGSTGAGEYVAGWLSSLDTDTPTLGSRTVMVTGSTSRYGTFVPTAAGMKLVMRGSSSRLSVRSHAAGDPLTTWTAGGAGMTTNTFGATSAPGGGTIAASETDGTNHVVSVQRFAPDGTPGTVELQLTGYGQPALASDGSRIWMLMVREADGLVVSREWSTGSGWSTQDRVEVGPDAGGNLAAPNPLRAVDGRLHLIVRGPSGGDYRASVLAFQRPS